MPLANDRLDVVVGDVLDPAALGAAVDGQEAVIWAVGTSRPGATHVQSDGVANLVRSMRARSVLRLVVASAVGVGGATDGLASSYRLRLASPGWRGRLADLGRMEDEVLLTELEWTIVRAPILTDGPQTGEYRVEERAVTPRGTRISRADFAAFLLKCAETQRYSRRVMAVAY
jgi:putative NADH-flavin reductase